MEEFKWMRGTKGTAFAGIGPLEADILVIVWDKERVSVRDVYETLRAQRRIAYTTVMTVMNNLAKKDLLKQDRAGIAYHYTPAVPGAVVAQAILDNVIERLYGGRRNVAVSHLLGLAATLTPEQVDELKRYAEEHLAG